jgi:hypothetical protein
VRIDRRQLQSKFKHASDFGIQGSYNRDRAEQFARVLQAHVAAPSTRVIHGTFRGRLLVVLYVDPDTGLVVMTDPDNNFLSGWRLSGRQLIHVLQRGTL